MKVLFFTTACEPQMEVQRVHQEFLQAIQARGGEVSILTTVGGESRGEPYRWEEVEGIPICRFALRSGLADEARNRLSRALFHYDGFLTILRRYRDYFRLWPAPDLVHVESAYPLGAVTALARRSVPIPYVITVRGADLFNEPAARFGYARYPLVRRLLRLAFRHAAAIRATSRQTHELVCSYGAPPERVFLIPRNIRNDCFPQDLPAFRAAARAEVLERHGLPAGGRLVVAAGRLLPIKGFDLLLQALPSVLSAVPETWLLLCGGSRPDPVVGDYRAYLERLAGEYGVRERVIFTGEVPAGLFTRYLAAADLVVVSSIREGSNKVLLEAAALGTPFVATETSGTSDFFRNPPGGVEVPPGDVPALSAAMVDLLRNEGRRRLLGEQAARSSRRFHSEQVAEEMWRLYRRVLTQGKREGADF